MNTMNSESVGHCAEEAEPTVGGLPPVRVILAAIVWLAARQRERATPQTRHALVCQAHRLLLHPHATHDDQIAGVRLAGLTRNNILARRTLFVVAPGHVMH